MAQNYQYTSELFEEPEVSFMGSQKTFKSQYAEKLLYDIKSGASISLYSQDVFPIDEDNILYIPSILHPEGLVNKMKPSKEYDFESAIALYEAYKDLSPLQASDRAFWIYLAHTELFKYVQERYNSVIEPGFNKNEYILEHWFFKEGPLRNSLSGLWWAVYLSIDDKSDCQDKYRYTQFFLSDINMRNVFLGRSSVMRHKEAAIGILHFLIEDEEVRSAFFRQRMRYITKYFNKLGGTRQLTVLDRDFFINELKRIRPQIMAIQSEEDLKNS